MEAAEIVAEDTHASVLEAGGDGHNLSGDEYMAGIAQGKLALPRKHIDCLDLLWVEVTADDTARWHVDQIDARQRIAG